MGMMTMEYALKLGITPQHAQHVYSDPGVMACGYDGKLPSFVDHPLATYLSAFIGDRFAGAYLVIRRSLYEFELHSLLLQWAVLHSRALSIAAVNACFEMGANRVSALILDGLMKTVNLCKKIGFQYEGYKRGAVMVNGKFTGVHILGVTRDDWGWQ